jgi:hypothetical protein
VQAGFASTLLDVTAITGLVRSMKAPRRDAVHLTPTDAVARALVLAARRDGALNGALAITDEAGRDVLVDPARREPKDAVLASLPAEVVLCTIGAITQRTWVVDGCLAVRDVVTVTISIDRRVSDHSTAARVLDALAELAHDPALALL